MELGDIMNLKNLMNYRIEKGISQKEMIEVLNISKGTYSAWESGKDNIPLYRLNEICNYLGISIDYALGISNKENCVIINKDLDLKLIGKRIKAIRKDKKYTLKKLATALNTSISVISRYENGHTLILTSFIYEYSKLFNVSVDYLLGKTNEPNNQ